MCVYIYIYIEYIEREILHILIIMIIMIIIMEPWSITPHFCAV